MDNNKLQEEMVVEGKELCNILNFHDFVLEESKKDKKEAKKSKKLIKNREEYIEDMDIIDPNECPERYVKLREEFIREDYK
jgi:translation initiation factor IF-3